MKIYSSFRYQLSQYRKSIEVYYFVWVCITVLVTLVPLLFSGSLEEGAVLSMGGLSAGTAIVAFVLGLNSFKENFGMAVQNGVSRKSMFLGHLCTSAALCAVLAVMDEVFTQLFGLIGMLPGVRSETTSLLLSLYGLQDQNMLVRILYSVAFSFFLLLAAFGLGYFITVLYYRLNKPGKIAVSVAVPAFFIVIVPLLKELRDLLHLDALWQSLERAVFQLLQLAFGAPWNCMLTCLVLFAAFSALAWLLVRRVSLKKAKTD